MAGNKTPDLKKQLKIKSGVVKRLAKEQKMYAQENQDQKLKLDKLAANDADGWELKNGKRMLEESERMIKDINDRLGAAVRELRDLVIQSKADPALSEALELLKAEEELEAATL